MKNDVLLKLIKSRRSKRVFTDKKISDQDLKEIIEAGVWSPTGCNVQELRFLIISKAEQIKKIQEFKPFVKSCSHFILVLIDTKCEGAEMYEKFRYSKNLPFLDTGIALQSMALLAESKGISSCICNLSSYHKRSISKMNCSIFSKIYLYPMSILGMTKYSKQGFLHILKKDLKVPSRYIPTGGITLGYSTQKIDLEKQKHNRRPLKRREIDNYIL